MFVKYLASLILLFALACPLAEFARAVPIISSPGIQSPSPLTTLPGSAMPSNVLPTTKTQIKVVGATRGPLVEALARLNAGDLDKAAEIARQVLQGNPKSAPAHELLGAVLVMQDKVDEGLAELQQAIQLNPKQSTAHTKIGDVQMARGNAAEAKQSFEEAIRLDPADRLPYQRLGMLYEREKDTAKAIAYYEKGMVGVPSAYLGVKVNLASLYNSVGRFDEARRLLEGPAATDRGDADAHVVLGSAYLGLGQTDKAIAQYQIAAKIAPASPGASLGLGMAYRERGDLAQSKTFLQQLVRARPDESTGYYQLGETQFREGNHKEALASFKKAETLSPNPTWIRKRMADTHAALGEMDQAVALYQQLADSPQAGPAAWAALGTAYQLQDKLEEAKQTFLTLVQKFPSSPLAHLTLGNYYGYVRDYRTAVASFEQGLKLAPKNPALLHALALAYSRVGEPAKAAATAKQLADVKQNDVEARFLYASLLDEAGNGDEAMKLYKAILADKPDHVGALNNLAMQLVKQGKAGDALGYAEKAKNLASKNPLVMDTYGWTLVNVGRVEEAVTVLQQAAATANRNPSILYHYAVARQRAGDKAGAQASLQEILSLPGEFPEKTQAQEALRAL